MGEEHASWKMTDVTPFRLRAVLNAALTSTHSQGKRRRRQLAFLASASANATITKCVLANTGNVALCTLGLSL